MQITFRPLPVWPYKPTKGRGYAHFKVSYPRTLDQLAREVANLGGKDVVMGVGLEERDLRLDGTPRANARAMSHPGVELSFDSRDHGRLTYATDQYSDWQDNVRAIALSLEALRAVDRHGVAKGRQYTGFALLAAGPGLETVGAQIVAEYGSIKKALQATHPDTGSARHTQSDYQAVLAFRKAQGPA